MQLTMDQRFVPVRNELETDCEVDVEGNKVVCGASIRLITRLAAFLPYLLSDKLGGGGDIAVVMTGIMLDVHERSKVGISDDLIHLAILHAIGNSTLIVTANETDDRMDNVIVSPVWTDRQRYTEALADIEAFWVDADYPYDPSAVIDVLCALRPFLLQWAKDRLTAPSTAFLKFDEALIVHLAAVSGVNASFIQDAFLQLIFGGRLELNEAAYLTVSEEQ